ncbi:MAG TPA: metal ABC transporter ATP-binding protein [Candidatus Limnocylindrales bacterium]|nr:metal ABC transporter ATP-binding protein [Candidatus Limnocylindrales bacterium]
MEEVVVSARNLCVTLSGRTVLEEVTFDVRSGEFTGIIGPNGAGKTTLLRAILGLVPIQQGEIVVMGTPSSNLRDARSRIGYMPQHQSFDRRFPLSAADVVATGLLSPRTLLRSIIGKKSSIAAALHAVGMEQYSDRSFQDLSGGEQQRILLARSLVRRPELLLLDEPSAGLDFPAQQSFIELLHKLQRKDDLTVILVSHDLVSVAAAADKLVCINRSMHIHGRPGAVLHSLRLDEAYRCQFELFRDAEERSSVGIE